ncbi:S8 family peptidase [Candidatus Berkelbacteria bacterium]|nr:S8 family peptidase [Candidatus Berkelbacteria bacterium]
MTKQTLGLALTLALIVPAPLAAGTSVSIHTSRKIVTFRSEQQHTATIVAQAGEVVQTLDEHHGVAARLSDAAVSALEERSDVVSVVDDPVIRVTSHTRGQQLPWGIDRVDADRVWSTTAGTGSVVAIVDTGIDLDHPDLVGTIAGSTNIIRADRSADDDSGHGTHVAGIVAARNNTIGVVGVAPSASLLAVKVLDRRGAGYLSDIVAGIDWAADHGADVINLSLGTSVDFPLFHDAISTAVDQGVVIVAASGNSGGSVLYPAAYDGVIAVGATDDTDEVQRWSSRGAELDLVAPGEDIYSTYKGGRYRDMTGTSMAAPHVSGAAALLIAQPSRCDTSGDSQCSPAEVKSALQAAASDLLTSGWDSTSGYGFLNVARLFGL